MTTIDRGLLLRFNLKKKQAVNYNRPCKQHGGGKVVVETALLVVVVVTAVAVVAMLG